MSTWYFLSEWDGIFVRAKRLVTEGNETRICEDPHGSASINTSHRM